MPAESCTTTPAADLPDLDGNANSTNHNVLLCLQLVLLIMIHTIWHHSNTEDLIPIPPTPVIKSLENRYCSRCLMCTAISAAHLRRRTLLYISIKAIEPNPGWQSASLKAMRCFAKLCRTSRIYTYMDLCVCSCVPKGHSYQWFLSSFAIS